MASLYAVWVQPVDNDTSPENVERFGMIEDLEEVYESDMGARSKDFCDGQTSPTAPRYADDQMGQLQFYSREAAEYVSAVLRNDLSARFAAGEISQSVPAAWGVLAPVTMPQTMAATVLELRLLASIGEDVTDSQIESAILRYVQGTGNPLPTNEQLVKYMTENTAWLSDS